MTRLSLPAARQRPGGQLAETGQPIELATQPVTIPAGSSATLSVPLPVSRFRDPILRRAPLQLVEARILDHAATIRASYTLVASYTNHAKQSPCKLPELVRYKGPAVSMRTPGARRGTFTTVRPETGDFPVHREVIASHGSITFTLNGLTYRAAKGTRFELGCTAVGAVRRGAWMPTPWLEQGSLTVIGTPRGRQYAATVSTAEGNLGTRSMERTHLVVSRNARRRIATLHVVQGRTGQITPVHTSKGSPCTSGSKLRVDRRGRISAA